MIANQKELSLSLKLPFSKTVNFCCSWIQDTEASSLWTWAEFSFGTELIDDRSIIDIRNITFRHVWSEDVQKSKFHRHLQCWLKLSKLCKAWCRTNSQQREFWLLCRNKIKLNNTGSPYDSAVTNAMYSHKKIVLTDFCEPWQTGTKIYSSVFRYQNISTSNSLKFRLFFSLKWLAKLHALYDVTFLCLLVF